MMPDTGRSAYRKIAALAAVLFLIGFGVFVSRYESYAYRQAQADIEKHGWVISNALWNFNHQGAFEYLVLASQASNYKRLTVTDTKGATFQEVFGEKPSRSQRLFLNLGLINEVPLEAAVTHTGKNIGEIQAIWYCDTIYLEVYILLALVMVWVILSLVVRLFHSKTILEERVLNRTRELNDLNTSLQVSVEEQRRSKEELRQSEEKFRAMLEQAAVGVALCDSRTGMYIQVNQRYCDIVGYAFQEFAQMSFQMISHPDDLQDDLDKMQLLLDGKIREFTIAKRYFHKNGSTVWVNVTVSPMWEIGAEPDYHLAIVEDITERRQAEAALRESEEKLTRSKKMESLGLLAGGVAHDLNNILSGIVSYPELLLMDLPEDSRLVKPIETIRQSGLRAAAIVQDLLTVARGVAITRESVNLNDIIQDYLDSPEFIKTAQFHPRVNITTDLDPTLLNISCSQVHVRKAIMNLVSNAAEAISGNGRVTLVTANCYVDRPIRGYDTVKTGEYALFSVADTGPGISPGDLERIFEPFYTKKVMGRSGTGLGLAVVWNVIQDHQGYIDVTTGTDGTTFELYLPITRAESANLASAAPVTDFRGNGETILVVDDVGSQREISCEILSRLGYETVALASGEEAVEYLQDNQVDLVLLDMIMDPGINGRETYARIVKRHPGQKAIIISGFAETGEVREAQKLGAGQYVKKPVTLEKIGVAVKEELSRQPFQAYQGTSSSK